MKHSKMTLIACVSAAILFSASQVFAGTIVSGASGGGPGLGTLSVPVIITPNPNNDNQTGGGPTDNNITVPLKRFDHTGYIDLVFTVVPDGDVGTPGTTEYKFVENVDNNTFSDWIGYTMKLGFGTGLGFTDSIAGDGLDFDGPLYDPAPSSTAFAFVGHPTEDILTFSGGSQSTGAEVYSFRIDVPDGITSFTIRQIPHTEVPEPSSIVLILCGVVALVAGKRIARA